MPLAHNVMAACKANGAVHLFPGNVYGYGSPMPLELTEDTPMRPSNSKGRIRVAMKELFRNESEKTGGVQTIVLRAGDYFGGTGKGTWLDFVLISKLSKGIYTAPGPENLVHEWAYLPDFAEAFVKLANARDTLLPFENLNFPGHAITDLQIKASIEKLTGKPLKLAHLPWRVLRILGIFQPMIKALVEMSYLRFQPHRLVSKRLAGLIGNVPHTPLDEAIKQALIDQGLSVANIQKSA